eukprot:1439368-Alexandrium_andersonii.AAC.1
MERVAQSHGGQGACAARTPALAASSLRPRRGAVEEGHVDPGAPHGDAVHRRVHAEGHGLGIQDIVELGDAMVVVGVRVAVDVVREAHD